MFLAGSPLLSLPSVEPSLLDLDDDVLECVASSLPCSAACFARSTSFSETSFTDFWFFMEISLLSSVSFLLRNE